MTETGRSAPTSAGDRGLPPPAVRTRVAQVAAVAAAGCAVWGLVGRPPWAVLGTIVGVCLAGLWLAHRARDRWPQQRAVDRALREHVDPGTEHRAAADRAARQQLERPRTAVLACGIVMAGGLALACVVVAVVRDDLIVALSAVPLVGAFLLIELEHRRLRARAGRWLADPPPRVEEAPWT